MQFLLFSSLRFRSLHVRFDRQQLWCELLLWSRLFIWWPSSIQRMWWWIYRVSAWTPLPDCGNERPFVISFNFLNIDTQVSYVLYTKCCSITNPASNVLFISYRLIFHYYRSDNQACVKSSIIFRENTPYTVNETSDGLFCIETDNCT